MFSVASQIAEVELFFEALYLYSLYWEWQGYSSPCLYLNFASVMILCRVSSCIPSFSWRGRGVRGAFYTFTSFLSWVGHRGGGMGCLPSCVFVFIRYRWKKIDSVKINPLLIFPVYSFLLLSCLSCFKHPSLLSRDFPSTFFCSIYFFFLLLVSCFYTLRPFQIVLLTLSCGAGRREIRRFEGRRV